MQLLVFDMGHVFIDFEWETVCNGFCTRSGMTMEQLQQVMREVAKLGYESGHIDTAGFLRELNRHLSIELTREEFTEIWTQSFRENADMADLLQKLRKQRPLYLLSNTNEVHYEWLQAHYDVARHFDELILSYKVGCSKPDPQIYSEVLRRSGKDAGDCLFIDDLRANVDAAARLGMHTILFQGIEHLKQQLAAHGLEI